MPRTPSDLATAPGSAPDPATAQAPAPAPTTPPAVDPTVTATPVPPDSAPVVDPIQSNNNVPIAAPIAASSVVVNIPAAPVFVDEHYTLDYYNEIDDPRGNKVRIVEKGNKDGSDKLVRYRIQQGTGIHVKSTEARLLVENGVMTAQPTDGRPALQLAPKDKSGKTIHTPGCFAVQPLVGR